MLRDEKLRNASKYAEDNYGYATLLYILPFKATCGYLLETIRLDGAVLKRIDSGEIPTVGDARERLSFKQIVLVNALSKLALCTESLAALWCALREPKHLPEFMLRYSTAAATDFLRTAARGSVEPAEIWKTLAFPEVERLPLSV